jgi:ATP-dependent Clp protease ATP-binding subunit ClpC
MKIDIPIIRFDYIVGNDHYYVVQSVTMDWYGYSLLSYEDAEEQLLKGLPKLNEQYFEDELRFILNLNKGFKPELSHIEYNPNIAEFNEAFIIPYVLFEIDGHHFVQILFFFKMKLFHLGDSSQHLDHDKIEDTLRERLNNYIKRKILDENGEYAPLKVKNKTLLAELKGDFKVQTYEINALKFDFNKRAKITKYTKDEDNVNILMSSGQELSGDEELKKVAYLVNEDYPNQLKPFLGQQEIVDQTYNLLSNTESRSFLVKGPPGSGKQSLIHQCIYKQENSKGVKENTGGFEVWEMDPHALISGMSMVGQWENRIESILQYIIKQNSESKNRIILLFSNIVALIQGGKSSQNSLSFSKVLLNYIRKKEIQIVVLCTEEEWAIANEKDNDFMNLLLPIALPKITLEQCLDLSIDFKRWAENRYNCAFHPLAMKTLVDYVRNYAKHEALPGALFNRINNLAKKNKYSLITALDAEEHLNTSNKSNFLSKAIHPKDFNTELTKQLIGQPKAIDTLCNAYQLINAGFSNSEKPLGSFLFIGPTGVGKTQAAKLIAKLIHGNEDKLLRIDLNEYVGYDSVGRLIGSPLHGEGTLTRMVRNNPHGVLLLDEVEKANKNVINLLLQVLDDARLTDHKGKVVSFSNLIIIMSSNLGAKEAASMMGFTKSKSEMEGVYRKAVYSFFKPEFINRIDEVVIFNSLDFQNILQIAKLQMADLLLREGFVRRNSILSVEESALEWVAKRGYDDLMGGRGLKRQIEKDITALSAMELAKMEQINAILLRVYLEKEKLGVNIIPFEFSERLDPLKGIQNEVVDSDYEAVETLVQYYELLDEKLRSERADYVFADKDVDEENNQVLLTFYELQNKLIDNQQELKTIFLEGKYNQNLYPFRFKQNEFIFTTEQNIENQVSQLLKIENDALPLYKEFGKAYDFHDLNQKYIAYQAVSFGEGEFEHFFIEIRSVQFDQWSGAKTQLLNFYKNFLVNLGASTIVHYEEDLLEVRSFGLFKLLASEIGLHVFYQGAGKMSFFNVNIFMKDDDEAYIKKIDYEIKPEIIRLYILDQIILDLKTNTIGPFELNTLEYQFLNHYQLLKFNKDLDLNKKNSQTYLD